MKKFILYLSLFLAPLATINAQSVSLGDMLTLASYENWASANTMLVNKGWEYDNSEGAVGMSNHSVTWAFDKSPYSDAAVAWAEWSQIEFGEYKTPYVILQVHNINTYKNIHNSIASYGFKFDETTVEKGVAKTTYRSEKYTLIESTSSNSSDDYSSYVNNIYIFEIYMNFEYSPTQNGYKKVYFEGSNQLKATYTLLKGKLNGLYTEYNKDGEKIFEANYVNDVTQGKYIFVNEIKHTTTYGNYVNDKKDGPFTEFDSYGKKCKEGFFKQDFYNGKITEYNPDGSILCFQTYKIGVLEGPSEFYQYLNDTVMHRIKGQYINDNEEGMFYFEYVNRKTNKPIESRFLTFKNGELHGQCVDYRNDSLIFANYENGLLHGQYTVYIDVNHGLLGNPPTFDKSKCFLLSEGVFIKGVKSGYWRNYDLLNKLLREEGDFLNGKKDGIWKVYNTEKYMCRNSDSTYVVDFGHLLLRQDSYQNGKLSGPAKFNYVIESEKYKCKNIHTPDDSCSRTILHRVDLTVNYKNDLKNGLYSYKDENGALLYEGQYLNGEKNGEWLEQINYIEGESTYATVNYTNGILDGEIKLYNSNNTMLLKGSYKQNKEDGEWSYYNDRNIVKKHTYNNGILHGPTLYYDELGALSVYEKFFYGDLDSIAVFDVLKPGTILLSHKILSKTGSQYSSRIKKFRGDTTEVKTQTIVDNDYSWDSEGVLNGSYSILLEGKPVISGQYNNGVMEGKWSYFLYDQSVIAVSDYKNGNLQTEEFFDLSKVPFKGKVKLYALFSTTDYEAFSVKDGKRNGTTTIYKNGIKAGKKKYKMGVLQE